MTTRSAVLVAAVLTEVRAVPLLYTAPPDSVILVKSFQVYSNAVTQVFELLVNRNPGAISPRFFHEEMNIADVVDRQTWIVLEPGDEIYAVYSQPTFYVWISGAVLPARP